MRFYKFLVLIFFVFGLTISSASCKKGVEPKADNLEQSVTLNKESATLIMGEEITLKPEFGLTVTPKRTYQWKTDNPDVVSVSPNNDYSATVKAKKKGTAKVSLSSTDGLLVAACTIVVEDRHPDSDGDGVIRILAIGNSFSQDAIENYLYDLAEKEGISVVIGNLYIGGASLDLHWKNANENLTAYSYRKIAKNGNMITTANTSIATALADEPWDYISFQQASLNSGQYNTYTTPLPLLYNYVKKKATNPQAKYILHQTWAYEQNSTHSGFPNYNKDQTTMYNAIVETVGKVKNLIGADLVVPAGTAIQNGRSSVIGDNFTRDGHHLDLNIGRYTAACTWFEAILGKNVIGNSFKPSALSDYEAKIAQHAAHYAVLKPNEVTEMIDYQKLESSGPLANMVFIDFGQNAVVDGWNQPSGFTVGSSILNLRDDKGNSTGITLSVIEQFNSRNTNGEKITDTELNIPETVSSDSYYGNAGEAWGLGDKEIKQSVLKLSGLDKNKKFNLCFYGSRAGVTVAGESRETKYISKGKTEIVSILETANNKSNIACANSLQPNDAGEIIITITAGENNNNKNGFYYINAMRISPSN